MINIELDGAHGLGCEGRVPRHISPLARYKIDFDLIAHSERAVRNQGFNPCQPDDREA